jgi:aspartyl-tRNA(Asn)/glutamyl-tRNA(Gln) amidotransferase subunit B
MMETKKDPEEIINENNLKQVVDMSAIESIVDTVLKNNTKAVEEYKQGKENSIQFLMGMVMKESKGTANPQIVIKMLKDKLS